jgi:hypothetical protein
MKTTTYTVRASAQQARRWARVARYLGCRAVSAWLEEMAEEQAARWDEITRQEQRRGRQTRTERDAGKQRPRGPL